MHPLTLQLRVKMKGIVINAQISDKFSNGQQTVSFKIDYFFGNWSWLFEKVQVKYVLNMLNYWL